MSNIPASKEELHKRDTRGIYQRAEKGVLKEFPGVSAPYDVPRSPDLVLDTDKLKVEECVDRIIRLLESK